MPLPDWSTVAPLPAPVRRIRAIAINREALRRLITSPDGEDILPLESMDLIVNDLRWLGYSLYWSSIPREELDTWAVTRFQTKTILLSPDLFEEKPKIIREVLAYQTACAILYHQGKRNVDERTIEAWKLAAQEYQI
jgi:hypothetical protein